MLICVQTIEDFNFVLTKEEWDTPIFLASVSIREQDQQCEVKMLSCGRTELFLRMEMPCAESEKVALQFGERLRCVSNIVLNCDKVQITP